MSFWNRITNNKKKWLVIGDSITEKNYRSSYNYHDYVSDWLNLEVVNFGASGTGYINDFNGVSSWIDRINAYPKDMDLITIMGALNDRNSVVGSFHDNDRTTLYGGLHIFYKNMIKKYPTVPIGVITSTPRIYCWGNNGKYVSHIDAVIEVGKHYSLPILDLYRCSGLRPWNKVNNKTLFSCKRSPEGDGVHLNDKGQLIVGYKVYAFIKNSLFYQR
jgi:lysophospholipase L1-like esterase